MAVRVLRRVRGVPRLELQQLVADFTRALVRQERSPATIRSYDFGWRNFLRFCDQRGVVSAHELDRDLIVAWQDHLRMRPKSKALASTAVRRLLTYAAEFDYIDYKLVLAVAHVRVGQGLPRPIPQDDLQRLAAWLERRRALATVVGLRNRALFWFLLTTGSRVSEALQVTRAEAAQAYVIQKGGSEKLLLAPPSVVTMIHDYVRARKDTSRWLWVTHTANLPTGRLGPKAVREIWVTLAQRARVKPFTSHQLRHTDATELLAANIPAPAIAEHLGHHDLRTLMNYAQVDTVHRQQVVDAMEKLVRRKGRRL